MQGRGIYFDELNITAVLNMAASAIKTAAPSDGYNEENFVRIFNRIVSEVMLKNAADAKSKYAILESDRYSELLGSKPYLDTEAYKLLKNSYNVSLFEYELLLSDFQQAVVITAANGAENAADLKAVVEENNELIGIVMPDGYGNLSGQQLKNLYDAMLKGGFESYDQIKSAFDTAYNSVKTAKQVGGIASSSGGSKSSAIPAAISEPIVIPAAYPVQKIFFEDVENLTWGKEEIISLAEKKIINGMSENIFEPDSKITREQFCQMAAAAFGIEGSEIVTSFKDADSSAWYISAISAMTAAGYISGIDEGAFGIGRNITRQDIAAVLYRILKDKMPESSAAEFADADEISEYAEEAVGALSAYNIINGYEDGSFKAKNEVTRREAAVMIYRALEIK